MNRQSIQHQPDGAYRADLETFLEQMFRELKDNEHKGNWFQWKPDLEAMTKFITQTHAQLSRAIYENRPQRVRELAADLANYAMKAYFTFGEGADHVEGYPFEPQATEAQAMKAADQAVADMAEDLNARRRADHSRVHRMSETSHPQSKPILEPRCLSQKESPSLGMPDLRCILRAGHEGPHEYDKWSVFEGEELRPEEQRTSMGAPRCTKHGGLDSKQCVKRSGHSGKHAWA